MRKIALLTLFIFFTAVAGGVSWIDWVLCIHSGDSASHAHVEKSELSDLSAGEVHVNLSPVDIVQTMGFPKIKDFPGLSKIEEASSERLTTFSSSSNIRNYHTQLPGLKLITEVRLII